MTQYAQLSAFGAYVPKRRVSNEDISQRVNTSDEWIRTHTGIRQRYFADDKQSNSDLASAALTDLLDHCDYKKEQIDYLIVTTITPDFVGTPSVANLVQAKVGLRGIPSFDLNAACSGFVYALELADALVRSNQASCVAIVSSEIMSRSLDLNDRATAILFGDGAAAVLITNTKSHHPIGILESHNWSDGKGAGYLFKHQEYDFEQAQSPSRLNEQKQSTPFLRMQGQKTYLFAVEKITAMLQDVKNRHPSLDLTYIVSHQANKKILELAATRLGIPLEKFYINIHEFANTSSASIPLSLHQMYIKGLLSTGSTIMTMGFGAGLTWGYNLIRF